MSRSSPSSSRRPPPGLRRTAYLVVHDWHLAEDLTQQALAKLYAAWPRARARDPTAYARRIVVNECLTYLRRKRPETTTGDVPERAPRADPVLDLAAALALLAPRQRAIVALRFLDDLPVVEVADPRRVPRAPSRARPPAPSTPSVRTCRRSSRPRDPMTHHDLATLLRHHVSDEPPFRSRPRTDRGRRRRFRSLGRPSPAWPLPDRSGRGGGCRACSAGRGTAGCRPAIAAAMDSLRRPPRCPRTWTSTPAASSVLGPCLGPPVSWSSTARCRSWRSPTGTRRAALS